MRFRELAHRSNDGVDITLLWEQESDSLSVAVHDERSATSLVLVVENGTEGLDVFRHPFPHAAWRGVDAGLLGAAA
jgi:hypothetical protein